MIFYHRRNFLNSDARSKTLSLLTIWILPALRVIFYELWTFEDIARKQVIPTNFWIIVQSIHNLAVPLKGQVDRYVLAEDSIWSRTTLFLSLPLSFSLSFLPAWLNETQAFSRFRVPLRSGKVGSTVLYKSAFGSHGNHTRHLITQNQQIRNIRQNEISCKFFIIIFTLSLAICK